VSNLFNNKYFIEALTLLKESDPDLFMETVFRLIANNKSDLLENQEANDVLGALTQMIQYFESPERQEFEKCAEIKTWMDEIKED
jgi:hypothetical protein